MNQGAIIFMGDDGQLFSVAVNDDGTCGPLPRAGRMLRWVPPEMGTLHFKTKTAHDASEIAESLRAAGFEVETHSS